MSDNQTLEQTENRPVACARCGDEHPLADMTQEETKRTDLIEVYLRCPSCEHRLHVYFDSPDLCERRERIRVALAEFKRSRTQETWQKYQHARQVYSRQFDRHNRHWRRKFGMYKHAGSED